MEGVVREEMGAEAPYAVLAGPSFAREVAQKQPTAVTVASRQREIAHSLQRIFSAPYFRVYTSHDVTGAELGGALKNIFAIGTGILSGMGLGDNPRAALITRGLAEMVRLGARLGANPMTLTGLAGPGRPDSHLHRQPEPQFPGRGKVGPGYPLGPDPGRHGHGGGRGEDLPGRLSLAAAPGSGDAHSNRHVIKFSMKSLAPKEAIKKLMARELKDEMEAMTETW